MPGHCDNCDKILNILGGKLITLGEHYSRPFFCSEKCRDDYANYVAKN